MASAADCEGDKWLPDFPVKVHPLGPAYSNYAYSPRVRAWLEKNLTGHDIVIINGVWQSHTRTAARIAKSLGVPYFIYAHGLLDPWNRSAHPIKYVKKFLYWALVEKWSLENADGVVFTSAEEARLAESYFPVSGWTPIVAGNGIARPTFGEADVPGLIKAFPRMGGRKIWLFLGRVDPKKGLEILIDAFPHRGDDGGAPLLVIVGDGDVRYVRRLKARCVDQDKHRNILWTGPLYGDDKWNALRAAELFLLPSHQENFGIAVVEALAMGVPVVTTRAVNIWREIESGKAGIICDDSAPSLREAMSKWAGMDDESRRAMGRAALKCFEQHFEIAVAAERLLTAMEQAAGVRRVPQVQAA